MVTGTAPNIEQVTFSSTAISSWLNSTRRFIKTCRAPFPYRARLRHGSIIFFQRRIILPLDHAGELIAELEAEASPVLAASSRGPAPGNEPSLSSSRGCPVSMEALHG